MKEENLDADLDTGEAYAVTYEAHSSYYDALHQDDYRVQDEMSDPTAFLAKSMGDNLYFHQAMQTHDRRDFYR